LAGPDVGGSMGGQDPEKYGPIRSILKHYAKKPHIFRSCVRDNRKRFGPRVNQVCAWVKDQIRGTTYWRGKEAELRRMMEEEGFTEADIQIVIYDSLHDQEMEYPPSREVAMQMCENCGVDYDPDAFDEACPDCGSWDDCECEGYNKAKTLHEMKMKMRSRLMSQRQMVEARSTQNIYPPNMSKAEIKKEEDKAKKDDAEADAKAGSNSGSKSKQSGPKNPREVARPENGTVVYDDGSIKDNRTGLVKYPVHVYQDGSVRYDDGSVARPGSLASLLIMQPMSKEDRARLFAAGPAGLAMKDFASVEELVDSVAKQAYAKAGVGGMGELAIDPLAQQQSMPGLSPASVSMVAEQGAGNLPKTDVKSPGANATVNGNDPNDLPLKPMRGEDIVRGPEGGRGVWRTIDKTPVFIKIGQSPNQAREERRAKANEQK